MDGQQGALNKLLAGDISGALNDIEVSLGNLFHDDIVPALKTFIGQFASDFGSQALSQAAALAPAVIAGTTSIQDAAVTLGGQLTVDAVTDAEKDGTVALNAMRVQITAQSPAPAVQQQGS